MLAPSPDLAAAPALYVCDAAQPQRLQRSVADLATGFRRWRLAWALARLDIRNRYRGSVLGPLWLTLSTLVMVASLGFLYAALLKVSVREYLPFLAISLIVWNTLNQIVTEACGAFTGAEGIIRQLNLPYSIHILRCVLRNLLVIAHNVPIILVIFAVCRVWPGPGALLAIPGLLLLTVNSFAAGLFLGMVCARFRDIPQIVINVMQLAFFVSPIIWKPDMLGRHAVWLPLNPFYSLIEAVRGPLVEGGAAPAAWISAILYTLVFGGVSLAFFVRFRSRVAFWV